MNGKFDVTNVTLQTNRLTLRAFRLSDLEDFYEYAKVFGVGQMAGWLPHKNIETSMEILKMFIEEKNVFAIVLKENNKVIGSLGIEQLNSSQMIDSSLVGREIGYVLSKTYWGNGLMPEACRSVIDYCFNSLNYDFLMLGYFTFNNQSKRVGEKLGFKFLEQITYKTRMETVETTNLTILYKNK